MRSLTINPWLRLALTALLGLACAGLASLGFWQLHRAAEKHARHSGFVERQAAEPVDFATLPKDASLADWQWRRVRVSGHYLDTHVVLDNRIFDRRAGYEVLTPFQTDAGAVVLVNRGWIPLPDDRDAVPDTLAPADPTALTGYLGPEPTVGIDLGPTAAEAELMSPQVFRVQRVHLPGVERLLERKLWPAVVYLDADALGALSVDWPLPGDDSARNRSYAVQWFAMAAALAALGLWNLYGRKRGHA